ncbi:MAG: HAD-IB family phosphatase [Saprospiraceae bacterium]|nr:HAD-IB family phosphatase [Saprospiraceae bacterium]
MAKTLHLCDFDGTLTRGDSLLHFLWFVVPLPRLFLGGLRISFNFLGLLLTGKWSNSAAKAEVLAVYLEGKTRSELQTLGEGFCEQRLPSILRTDLLNQLKRVQEAGETVVIVSASPDLWLEPFCRSAGFGLICTELSYESDIFRGQFATPNCNGPEKARRILAAYDLRAFDSIIAYGNSGGDAAMFDLAHKVLKF